MAIKCKYKYNYFYCAPYSLTDGALQKSADTSFAAVFNYVYVMGPESYRIRRNNSN